MMTYRHLPKLDAPKESKKASSIAIQSNHKSMNKMFERNEEEKTF